MIEAAHRDQPDPGSRPAEPAGDWLALHIYYAANPQPLLVQCVRPLIDRLGSAGLLAGHFFINYWIEGPHVRLRLKPASPAAAAEVRREAEQAVGDFLRRRPALYKIDSGRSGALHDTMLRMEVADTAVGGHLGEDGRMKYRQNNTFSYEPYEPEYAKYGGPGGVALAEWHFQNSSDLVIDLLRTKNTHVRTFRLGTATQLMMVMSASFLPDAPELAEFFDGYHTFWRRYVTQAGGIGVSDYGRDYRTMSGKLAQRFAYIRQAVADGDPGRLPGYLRDWATHCRELSDRVSRLAAEGGLDFSGPVTTGETTGEARITDPTAAAKRLLSPYLHMTNNRLHVTVVDESYLAYLLGRTLSEPTGNGDGPS